MGGVRGLTHRLGHRRMRVDGAHQLLGILRLEGGPLDLMQDAVEADHGRYANPNVQVGGVFLQWTQGYAVTTAVIIGYIAVLAVAVQTGIIMIEFIRDALARRTTDQPYIDAVIEGSVARLRPKLMTVATTVLGLIPIMLASGSGFDITQPIAAPSVGGMVTSTLHVLIVTPVIFYIMKTAALRRGTLRRSDIARRPWSDAAEATTAW